MLEVHEVLQNLLKVATSKGRRRGAGLLAVESWHVACSSAKTGLLLAARRQDQHTVPNKNDSSLGAQPQPPLLSWFHMWFVDLEQPPYKQT